MASHDSHQFENLMRDLVPYLIRNTKLKYFGANLPFTNDYSILHLKRQLSLILLEVTNYRLNVDCWRMIADILIGTHTNEFYWFVGQITKEYTPAMLPLLTADFSRKIFPYMLVDLATFHNVNLIMYNLKLPLQYRRPNAVQFNRGLLNEPEPMIGVEALEMPTASITWVINTHPYFCSRPDLDLGRLMFNLESRSRRVQVLPVFDIKRPTLLFTFNNVDYGHGTDEKKHIKAAHYSYYLDKRHYREIKYLFDSYRGPSWQAVLFTCDIFFDANGRYNTNQNYMRLSMLVDRIVRAINIMDDVVALVYQRSVYYVGRHVPTRLLIFRIEDNGRITMPYFTWEKLASYTQEPIADLLHNVGRKYIN